MNIRRLSLLFCLLATGLFSDPTPFTGPQIADSLDCTSLLDDSMEVGSLTPEQRLQRALFRFDFADPNCEELGEGIVNHNYRVSNKSCQYFARVAGLGSDVLGIDREAEVQITTIAGEARLAPKVVKYFPEEQVVLFDFVRGKTIPTRFAAHPRILKRVALIMRQCHQIKEAFPREVSPFERIAHYYKEGLQRGVIYPDNSSAVLRKVLKIQETLASDPELAPCHLDIHAGNLIHDGRRIWLVDWEFSGMCHPLFDLGSYASSSKLSRDQVRQLLHFYSGNVDQKQLAKLHLYTAVADIYWSMWAFLETKISDVDADYSKFAKEYWDRFVEASSQGNFHQNLLLAHSGQKIERPAQ